MRWFRRLADVSGVSYEGSPRVDRAKLPGHDDEPTVEVYEFGGERQEHLSWPGARGGSTSASPVHRRVFGDGPEAASREDLLRWIEETLEQPGELSDYHFAIQLFCEAAYKRRQEDPAVLTDVERFCFVDIELVENYPETIEYEPGKFYRVLAFDRLVALYEREGYIHEALEVAERSLACGQDLERKVEELRERVAALEAENAS